LSERRAPSGILLIKIKPSVFLKLNKAAPFDHILNIVCFPLGLYFNSGGVNQFASCSQRPLLILYENKSAAAFLGGSREGGTELSHPKGCDTGDLSSMSCPKPSLPSCTNATF
jgi:hypothetical protein